MAMKLYFKILMFLKPYWKHVCLSIFLTLGYVLFNTFSLWVSVDFISVLFPETTNVSSQTLEDGNTTESPMSIIEKKQASMPLYKKIKASIKKMMIRGDQQQILLMICLFIFISFVLKNFFDYFRKVINKYVQLKIIISIRSALQQVVMRLPLSYFDVNHSGELTSIAFNDVKSVQQVLNNSFGKLVLSPIQIIITISLLVLISWKLALITFIILPLSGILIFKVGQSMRRKSRRVFQQISLILSAFQESVSSIVIVKAFTSENAEIKRFDDANKVFFTKQFRAHKLGQATSPINEIFAVFILVFLLWYGARLVYNSEMVADDFIRFIVLLFALFQPLKELSGLNNVLQRGVAAAERIFKVIETPQEVYHKEGDLVIEGFQNDIKLNNVGFSYGEDGPEVLRNISFEIRKGETIAFVGHSGSGKSTLVNLIPRFYELKQGSIEIDGQSILDIDLLSLRRQIGIVTQDTLLFNDTIRYNISYGCDNVSDAAVIEAAKAANAWEFISGIKEGLDSVVGERGANLSGGQKQRLSIARAILKNPPILILDEATSALDTESEKLVQDAIETIMENRTVLIIAHRLSTVIHADKIVVLSKGNIVDIGRHSDLLKSCSMYKKLYDIQFRDDVSDIEGNI